MKLRRSRSVLSPLLRLLICFLLLATLHSWSLIGEIACATVQSSAVSRSTQSVPSKSSKVGNPLNDLLNEAQHAIDTSNFEGAIPPLQKFIAEKPDVAYAHFQLAYAFTALHRAD